MSKDSFTVIKRLASLIRTKVFDDDEKALKILFKTMNKHLNIRELEKKQVLKAYESSKKLYFIIEKVNFSNRYRIVDAFFFARNLTRIYSYHVVCFTVSKQTLLALSEKFKIIKNHDYLNDSLFVYAVEEMY